MVKAPPFKPNDPFGLHAYNLERLVQNEADKPARAARMSAETVQFWTEIVNMAATHIKPGRHPCDISPWSHTLQEVLKVPPFIGQTPPYRTPYNSLGQALDDIAQPGWPEPRTELIEFALRVLETDVMLFRSGYAKRHLIRRLQQSPLTDQDVLRIRALLDRAVLQGTGLEEARAYRKLAAHLVLADRLSGLEDWLIPLAEGTILSGFSAEFNEMPRVWTKAYLAKISRVNAMEHYFGEKFHWRDQPRDLRHFEQKDQRLCRTAFRMLRAIARRKLSEKQTSREITI